MNKVFKAKQQERLMMWWCLTSLLLLGFIEVEASSVKEKKAAGRIVGGTPVKDLDKYPFYAKVWTDTGRDPPRLKCGGTVLNKYEVLTAAHCLHGSVTGEWPSAKQLTVRTGDFTSNDADERGKSRTYGVAYYKYLVNYGSFTKGFDILLLYVSTPIVFDKYCQPLPPCLGKLGFENHLKYPLMGIGLGWLTSHTQTSSYVLREVDFVELHPSKCTEHYGHKVDTRSLCLNIGKFAGSCRGDSGGGVLLLNSETNQPECVYGVISYGSGSNPCEDPKYPTVSSRVAYYYPLFSKNSSSEWEIKSSGRRSTCFASFHTISFTFSLFRLMH